MSATVTTVPDQNPPANAAADHHTHNPELPILREEPAVYSAAGTDMVMERLDGPTMTQAMLAGSVSIAEGAEILAGLLRRLHAVPARGGLGSIVHLDLHPENVLMTRRGPVVIDWPGAHAG